MSKNNRFARAFYILLHFFIVLSKNDQILGFFENGSVWRKIFFIFPYFDVAHTNLVPGEFASIFQVKQILMIAQELQKREIIFLNDVGSRYRCRPRFLNSLLSSLMAWCQRIPGMKCLGVLLLSLDGMLVYRRATPALGFSAIPIMLVGGEGQSGEV